MGNEWFSDRLMSLANKRGLRQVDIVQITGASRASVSKWFAGISVPDPTFLTKLSEYFGVSVNWLLTGKEGSVGPETDCLSAYKPRSVPLLSFVQAGLWTDIGCGDPAITCSEWTETTAQVSDRAFALIVRGDSMSNTSNPRSIQDGAKVIIEPEFDPEQLNRKIVVAMLEGSNEATIKEFIQDGPVRFLKPFNPAYPTLPINGNCRIVGVVKQIIIDV